MPLEGAPQVEQQGGAGSEKSGTREATLEGEMGEGGVML